MARDRQRAKQRQAERRAERLGEGRTAPDEVSPSVGADDPARPDRSEAVADLAASAPPETVGRSDRVVDSPPPAPDFRSDEEVEEDEDLEELEGFDPEDEEGGGSDGPPSTRNGAGEVEGGQPRDPERGRVLSFLQAVVAELKRVQWPNRAQLTSLTGIVLGFVLIAGGYLGLLDAIFSRVIQALL